MKFYLSSYKLGNNPQALADLVGKNKRIAIIPNSRDVDTDMARREARIQNEKDELSKIGLNPQELDLRKYFEKEEELGKILAEFGSVWALGGNTFILRRAYKESGMDSWLRQHTDDEEFVYAGYSAGICVLSPSLRGLDTVDSPNLIAEGYTPDVIWEGVGLIDFAIAPHYQSDHPESEAVDKLVEYYKKNQIEYKALRDGEVLVKYY